MPFALYMLALAIFVMGTSEFMLAGLLPAIATDLDIPVGTAGLLTSAFAVGMVIGAPLMAALARRWPPRLTLLVCLLTFATCHVVGALTPHFSLLVLTRVLSALANAGFLAVALGAAAALVPKHRTGRAVSILLSGTTIATVAGVPAGALLGAALGWRATFWAVAILCAPAAVGVARGIANRPPQPTAASISPSLRAELALLSTPRLLLPMVLGALINGATFAVFTFLAPLVTETAQLSEIWVPVTLVMFGIGSFIGVVTAGRFSDQRPRAVLAVGGPLLVIGWVAMASMATLPVVLVSLVLAQGALSFAVGSTVIARVLSAAAQAPTMGGAYATAALNIGAATGPILGGAALAAGTGALGPVWIAIALTGSALGIALLWTRGHFDL